MGGKQQIVIAQENHAGANITTSDKVIPLFDHHLAAQILRMCFASKDQLHRPFSIGENPSQPLWIVKQERRSLVGCKPAGEADGQRLWVENGFRLRDLLSWRALLETLSRESLSHVLDERLACFHAHFPELFVADVLKALDTFQRSTPAILATLVRPKLVSFGRVPCGHMNPVRHRANRYFDLWPVREESLEDLPAHCAMKLAHAIRRAAAAQREIRHIEGLGTGEWIFSSQGHQLFEFDMQILLGIFSEVLFHQFRRKTIEAGLDRRMRREKISRSRHRQCDVKGLIMLLHIAEGPLHHGECGVPFVQVANLGVEIKCRQESPPSYA